MVLPLVAGSVGVLALGGATYFYARGIHDGDALRARCGSPPSCTRDEVDRVQTKLVVGDVLAGVALLAGGAVVYLLLARPSSPARVGTGGSLTMNGLRLRF